MKKYLGLLAVLIMALGLALNVSAAEMGANGDLNLEVNTPVNVTVGKSNQQLTFTPSKTQKYVFIVTGREYTYADAFEGNGEYLQWENNWYNNKKHIMISPVLQENVQYTIGVHNGSSAESETYKVAIYDDLSKGVDSLTIGKDYSGTINPTQNDAALYKVDINDDNKEVQFELSADKVDDLTLELYDQEFNQVAINRNRPYQSGMLYAGAALKNGTYYLKVYNQYTADNDIDYTLKMNPLKKRTTVNISTPPFLKEGETASLSYYDDYDSTEKYYADKVSFTTEDTDIISIIEGDFQGKKPGTAKIIAKNLAGEVIAQKEVTVYKDSITKEDAFQTIETNASGETVVAFTPSKSQKYLFKTDAVNAKLSLTRVEYNIYITSPTIISYVDTDGERTFTQTSLTEGGIYYLKIANVKGKKIQLGAYTSFSSDWTRATSLPFSEKQSMNNIESNYQVVKKITVNEAGNYTFKLASEDYTTARSVAFLLADENYNINMKIGGVQLPKEGDNVPYIRATTYKELVPGNYYILALCNNLQGKDISYRINAFRIAEKPITNIDISSIPNLTIDQTMKIPYEITPAATETDDTVLFESSDESVVTVTKDGEITAVGEGQAIITVMNSSGDVVKTSEVTVEKKKEPQIPEKPTNPSDSEKPTSGEKPEKPSDSQKSTTEVKVATDKTGAKVKELKIVAKSHIIAVGKKRQLKVKTTPNTVKNAVIWRSSNKKYATVNKNGKVLAKRAGCGKKVVITAIAKDGSGVKATYKIRIPKGIVKKIKITGNKKLKAGKTVKLKAKVIGTKGCYKKVTWISSNPEIATVTSSGKVKVAKNAKNKKVKITARVFDGAGRKAVIDYLIH